MTLSDTTLPPSETTRDVETDAAQRMLALASELFPICRSITGPGVRETLSILKRQLQDLKIREVPTGTQVLDWTIPPEWHIHDAFILNPKGEKVLSFADSNLHVVNYSIPIQQTMSLAELRPHLHTHPDRPGAIPYRTTYYHRDWGFCLAQKELDQWPEGKYEVFIDAELIEGSLTYGEWFLPGETTDEVLFSCHICHPSLANDNLSSIAIATQLAKWLAEKPRRYSYRILFVPGTIGAITWLAMNEQNRSRVKHGLVLALLGDAKPLTYKQTRNGDKEIDRMVEQVLQRRDPGSRILDFEPYGYDERQFNSPGIALPVGRLTRSVEGGYPEYHTSDDNLEMLLPEQMDDSLDACCEIVETMESNRTYQNLSPFGEPQLGRRGLYRATGGKHDQQGIEQAMLWVLNQSDGQTDLVAIAEKSKLSFDVVRQAAELLVEHDLLKEMEKGDTAGSPDNTRLCQKTHSNPTR